MLKKFFKDFFLPDQGEAVLLAHAEVFSAN